MLRTASRFASAALVVDAGLSWIALGPSRGSAPGTPFVPSTRSGDWPSYTGDARGSRYSPLDQINAGNFNDL